MCIFAVWCATNMYFISYIDHTRWLWPSDESKIVIYFIGSISLGSGITMCEEHHSKVPGLQLRTSAGSSMSIMTPSFSFMLRLSTGNASEGGSPLWSPTIPGIPANSKSSELNSPTRNAWPCEHMFHSKGDDLGGGGMRSRDADIGRILILCWKERYASENVE